MGRIDCYKTSESAVPSKTYTLGEHETIEHMAEKEEAEDVEGAAHKETKSLEEKEQKKNDGSSEIWKVAEAVDE